MIGKNGLRGSGISVLPARHDDDDDDDIYIFIYINIYIYIYFTDAVFSSELNDLIQAA